MRIFVIGLVISFSAVFALGVGATAIASPAPALQITKIQTNTDGHHLTAVKSGGTVTSCESDPVYSITFFYRWSHMRIPGKQRLNLSGPGHPDHSPVGSLFEASGNNAGQATAEEYKVASLALPAGRYQFRATLDGTTRKAAVTLHSSSC
jgi:hypothetical protein